MQEAMVFGRNIHVQSS